MLPVSTTTVDQTDSLAGLQPSSSLLFSSPSYCSVLSRTRTSLSIGGPEENYQCCEVEVYDPETGEPQGVAIALEQISIQTFSHVYKGYFSEGRLQGQFTVIKVLTTGFSYTSPKAAEVLERLYEREVSSLTKVQHPNVVQLMGVGMVMPRVLGSPGPTSLARTVSGGNGSAPNSPMCSGRDNSSTCRKAILLNWMPGGDARSLINQAMRPMDETAASTIILPVARALEACHSAGIVHRDVKASNVLLAPGPGQVCLADWGISVPVSESGNRTSQGGAHRTPATIGTEYWCAPEIERGLPHDESSDIFSLAITFVELITGRDPQYDNSAAGIRSLNLPATGFLPDSMSLSARSWVAPCLSPNPRDRPSIRMLLNQEFFMEAAKQVEYSAYEMERSSRASSHFVLTPLPAECEANISSDLLPSCQPTTPCGKDRSSGGKGADSSALHQESLQPQHKHKRKHKKRRGFLCCFQPSNASDTEDDRQEAGMSPEHGSSRFTEEPLHLPPHLQRAGNSEQVVWAPGLAGMEVDSPCEQDVDGALLLAQTADIRRDSDPFAGDLASVFCGSPHASPSTLPPWQQLEQQQQPQHHHHLQKDAGPASLRHLYHTEDESAAGISRGDTAAGSGLGDAVAPRTPSRQRGREAALQQGPAAYFGSDTDLLQEKMHTSLELAREACVSSSAAVVDKAGDEIGATEEEGLDAEEAVMQSLAVRESVARANSGMPVGVGAGVPPLFLGPERFSDSDSMCDLSCRSVPSPPPFGLDTLLRTSRSRRSPAHAAAYCPPWLSEPWVGSASEEGVGVPSPSPPPSSQNSHKKEGAAGLPVGAHHSPPLQQPARAPWRGRCTSTPGAVDVSGGGGGVRVGAARVTGESGREGGAVSARLSGERASASGSAQQQQGESAPASASATVAQQARAAYGHLACVAEEGGSEGSEGSTGRASTHAHPSHQHSPLGTHHEASAEISAAPAKCPAAPVRPPPLRTHCVPHTHGSEATATAVAGTPGTPGSLQGPLAHAAVTHGMPAQDPLAASAGVQQGSGRRPAGGAGRGSSSPGVLLTSTGRGAWFGTKGVPAVTESHNQASTSQELYSPHALERHGSGSPATSSMLGLGGAVELNTLYSRSGVTTTTTDSSRVLHLSSSAGLDSGTPTDTASVIISVHPSTPHLLSPPSPSPCSSKAMQRSLADQLGKTNLQTQQHHQHHQQQDLSPLPAYFALHTMPQEKANLGGIAAGDAHLCMPHAGEKAVALHALSGTPHHARPPSPHRPGLHPNVSSLRPGTHTPPQHAHKQDPARPPHTPSARTAPHHIVLSGAGPGTSTSSRGPGQGMRVTAPGGYESSTPHTSATTDRYPPHICYESSTPHTSATTDRYPPHSPPKLRQPPRSSPGGTVPPPHTVRARKPHFHSAASAQHTASSSTPHSTIPTHSSGFVGGSEHVLHAAGRPPPHSASAAARRSFDAAGRGLGRGLTTRSHALWQGKAGAPLQHSSSTGSRRATPTPRESSRLGRMSGSVMHSGTQQEGGSSELCLSLPSASGGSREAMAPGCSVGVRGWSADGSKCLSPPTQLLQSRQQPPQQQQAHSAQGPASSLQQAQQSVCGSVTELVQPAEFSKGSSSTTGTASAQQQQQQQLHQEAHASATVQVAPGGQKKSKPGMKAKANPGCTVC